MKETIICESCREPIPLENYKEHVEWQHQDEPEFHARVMRHTKEELKEMTKNPFSKI